MSGAPMINGRNLNELLSMPPLVEIDGRLAHLQKQRNDGQDAAVLQAGQIALLTQELGVARKTIEQLQAEVDQLKAPAVEAPAEPSPGTAVVVQEDAK